MAVLKEGQANFGFGLMRLPKPDGKAIDIEQVKKMVDIFLENGFVYFDTAFVYENSEDAIRQALVERYPRDKFLLATKLMARKGDTIEDIHKEFETSLARTGAGYFDYYLLHNVAGDRIQVYEDLGLWDYMEELKAKGLIKHYGFSCHDTPEGLEGMLTRHPGAEFVQLQINYLDWEDKEIQARRMYEVARSHGKDVFIMEPCKGGALAGMLPETAQKIFDAADPDASYASWALRYAAALEGVKVVLSGMSNIEQVEDNVSFMKDIAPLTDSEKDTISKVIDAIHAIPTIQCTACEYCVKGCPMGIAIPKVFAAYNNYLVFKDMHAASMRYGGALRNGADPAECIGCGSCEGTCPQHLEIRRLLAEAVDILGKKD